MSANMGGKSTSQGAVLGNDTTRHGYDLLSWQGVAEMLKDGREHVKDPLAYAEFRDLVLAYSRSGGDKELKAKLDAIVATFGTQVSQPKTEEKKIEVKEQTAQPVTKGSKSGVVGRTRSTPSFMPVSVPETDQEEPESVIPKAPKEEQSSNVPPAPMQEEHPEEEQPHQDEVKEDVPQSQEPAPEVEVQKPEPVPEPVPHPSPVTPEPQPVESGTLSVDEARTRIAEIKREVTEKIGNPAALVDTHNEAGKVYMTALLSALKALVPGGPIGLEKAMSNLESAYATLLEIDTFAGDTKEEVKEVATPVEQEPAPAVTPTPAPVPQHTLEEVEIQEEVNTEVKEPEETPVLPTETPQQFEPEVPKERPNDVPSNIPIVPTPVLEPQSQAPEPIVVEQEQEPAPTSEAPESQTPVTPPESPSETLEEPQQARPKRTPGGIIASLKKDIQIPEPVQTKTSTIPVAESPQQNIPSTPAPPPVTNVSENAENKTFISPSKQTSQLAAQPIESDTPIPGSIKTTVQQSELASPEINKALHDLLDEWPLFAGSGLFGIGPGGMEHPLYKKLSMLSMGEIMAGRWDKADPKIIKVLKEYVNAWRHEQGVAYTINETFEHYLRRVVQRILKRQKMGENDTIG